MPNMFIRNENNFGDNSITITISEEPTNISSSNIVSFKSDPCVFTNFSLVETTDKEMFIRFQPDDDEVPICYSHSDDCIPLFIYFKTESIESERNHGEFLESYTIIIVYQHEIVKLSLKKDMGYDIEFESCNVDRIGLFNKKSGMIIREYMFEICPEVENGMKGLAVHTGHDGQDVIEVVKFNFNPIDFLKNVVIQSRWSITMPLNFRSNEISADCDTGLFSLTGSYCTDDDVLIIISREINEYGIEFDSRFDSRVILIYQKVSTIVLVNYNSRMKNRLDNAQYDHVGELIVSCKIPQFVQELKKIHKYIPRSDESDNDE
jgi:hypothetical protein